MNTVVNYLGPDGYGAYRVDLADQSFHRIDAVADTLLIPGFVDIHTHGAFGIDFMSATTALIEEWCAKLRQVGYEALLPTTVTASAKDVGKAVANLPSHPMIAGFHLEGPFISHRYPGAQPQKEIAGPPSAESDWDAILDDPRLKVVTLAPELPGALSLISRLTARGVRVSLGHTNATYAEAVAAFEAGAAHTTHTFNAMRPLHHREPGMVGFALVNDSVYSELIYDRKHVSPQAATVLVRCKPADKLVAISDSTMAAGMQAGQEITMWNLKCVVGEQEVRLVDGTLAGSAITLLDAFRNLHEDFGLEVAIRACCLNPRASIGMTGSPKLYVEMDKRLEIIALHNAS